MTAPVKPQSEQFCSCCYAATGNKSTSYTRILVNGVWVCTRCDNGGWIAGNQPTAL